MKYLWFFLLLAVATADHSNTRIVVLGIAQDGGIPHLGCNQKICRTQRHYVSSLALIDGQNVYLFDATPDLREQSRELISRSPEITFKKNVYDGIFLTHAHMGHYSGLLFFGKESIASTEIPVYCSNEMAHYLSSNAPWSLLTANKNIVLRPFEAAGEGALKPISLGAVQVTPVSVPHRKEFTDTHGFMIQGKSKSVLFIPDIDSWEPVKEEMKKWLDHADVALLDGTFYSGDELPGRDMTKVPHPTIAHSIGFFSEVVIPKSAIYFIHLNHTNPLLDHDSQLFKDLNQSKFRVAAEWQEFPL